MRFSLLALIGFVAVAAVGCAALVNANDAWLVAVSTVTFVVVMAFSLIALWGRGSSRGFASGFAFCCTAYLLVIYFGLVNENAGTGRIATTRALNRLYSAVAMNAPAPGGTAPPAPTVGPVPYPGAASPSYSTVQQLIGTTTFTIGASPAIQPARDHFMQIGQQLWALLIGCLGGVFASWLWRRRRT